jgi:hypothetical protein
MKLRFWLKHQDDRISQSDLLKENPYEIPVVQRRTLNDGYCYPLTKQEAIGQISAAVYLTSPELHDKVIARIEVVDGSNVTVLYGGESGN